MNNFTQGKVILKGVDFSKLNDCRIELVDGIYHLIIKHNSGEVAYMLGFKTKDIK